MSNGSGEKGVEANVVTFSQTSKHVENVQLNIYVGTCPEKVETKKHDNALGPIKISIRKLTLPDTTQSSQRVKSRQPFGLDR